MYKALIGGGLGLVGIALVATGCGGKQEATSQHTTQAAKHSIAAQSAPISDQDNTKNVEVVNAYLQHTPDKSYKFKLNGIDVTVQRTKEPIEEGMKDSLECNLFNTTLDGKPLVYSDNHCIGGWGWRDTLVIGGQEIPDALAEQIKFDNVVRNLYSAAANTLRSRYTSDTSALR